MPKAAGVKSVQDAQKRLREYLRALDSVPDEELKKSANVIYAQAIAQTPYKTGKLEKSVYVRVVGGKSKRHTLSAGANAISHGYNYAGIQHENTKFLHPLKGKAHYISDPFNKEVKELKKRLKRRLKPKNGSR